MVLIKRFCNQLSLRRRLQRQVPIPGRVGNYHPSDLILALLYSLIAGLSRINQTQILQYNGTFLSLLGLQQFPDQSTLRRFLQRLPTHSVRRLVQLHDHLRQELFVLPRAPTTLIFDLDSVVLTLYGQQQGARIGYNPKKRGRRSYHPLLCFEAHRQEFWHGSLRPGDAAANTGVVPFLQRCLDKVPSHIARSRIRVRADAGFFSGKLIGFLDKMGLGYVVVVRLYPGYRKKICGLKYEKLSWGAEVSEFQHRPQHWKAEHRFVVIRRPIPEDPLEANQLTLFKDQRYVYTLLVTNLDLEPWRVWTFYRPPSDRRERHSRTALRFALGQNSQCRLGGQRSVLSNRAAGIQSGALVQTPVLANGLGQDNRRDCACRLLETARSTGAPGTNQYLATAQRLSLRKGVSARGKSRGKFATAAKKSFLQVAANPKPCIFRTFHKLSHTFTHF